MKTHIKIIVFFSFTNFVSSKCDSDSQVFSNIKEMISTSHLVHLPLSVRVSFLAASWGRCDLAQASVFNKTSW